MRRPRWRSVGLGAAPLTLLCALGACTGVTDGPRILTDSAGMTVYTHDRDPPGKSACTGSCMREWPPVPATEFAEGGGFGVIEREDGIRQLSYRGKPLYYHRRDERPGDTEGDRFLGLWHIVPLDGYFYEPEDLHHRRDFIGR